MAFNNKNALSPLIATVLLILISVSLISIIGFVLIPFVKDNLDESTNCSNLIEGIEIKTEKSCYDTTNTKIVIRLGNIQPDGIYVILEDGINSRTHEIARADLPDSGGGEKIYTLEGVGKEARTGPIINGRRCQIVYETNLNKCL